MEIAPKDLLEKLEFTKVLEILERDCFGELGREAVREMPILTDRDWIETSLREVDEYRRMIVENDPFPMRVYEDIAQDVRMLEIEGYVLSEESLQRIGLLLMLTRDIFRFFAPVRREKYPRLWDIIRSYTFEEGLVEAIGKVLDEKGEIRPDASPALLVIRKAVISKQKELDKVFRSLIIDFKNKGWLTDNEESFRNGRRVLSVPAEHKRKIRGIIHDESTTGKTAFIEPEPVIDINNDIFDLYQEEKREIYRILKELSAALRPWAPSMRDYQALAIRFDIIQTKARLAVKLKAGLPRLVNRPKLGIQMGYHPLLLWKNKQLGRVTVPFDLDLRGDNRVLVLSGPNAGGKSVTMKSVGLMQLMLQAGMLVPADEISEMGIFRKIFADIGDQQSLEDDLSTYSSRLQNMRDFLERSDEHTLVLIDEFGSGTDPQIGGAIAEAILKDFNERKVFGVITTHYSNLKIFAFKTEGILNGSMLYDSEHLSPTYQLRVGRPGSSYAFEIAQKSGLPKSVMTYARHRTGKNEKAVDELLVDLQRERAELEEKLKTAREREKQLEKLIRNYEDLHRDLEFRRKKLKLTEKESELQQAARENRMLEKLVREIKEEKNLEKAREIAEKVREDRLKLTEEVKDIREAVYFEPTLAPATKEETISAGDFVRLRSGGATGRVESISKNKAVVLMGDMRLTIQLRDLQRAKEPLEVRSVSSIQTDALDRQSQFQNKIDLRGMRMDEALKLLEEFVDNALMSNAKRVRIVHGKGSGVLRQAVRNKLKEYKAISQTWHPEEELGGDGTTWVEF